METFQSTVSELSFIKQPPLWMEMPLRTVHHWDEHCLSLKGAYPHPHFQPGQHIEVALEVEGQWIRRPFSLVNGRQEPFEIFVKVVPNGRMSCALQRLKPGAILHVSPEARGRLRLPQSGSGGIWLGVATGTGIAPLLSMLSEVECMKSGFETLVLLQGRRWEPKAAWPYLEKLQNFSKLYGSLFRLLLAWTRPEGVEELPNWEAFPGIENYPGRLTQWLESGDFERVLGRPLDAQRDQVMLCGRTEMARFWGNWLMRERHFRPGCTEGTGGFLVEAYG